VDCSHFEELISLELSGELEENAREALERHLASCSDCRETAVAWREQDAMFRGAFERRYSRGSKVSAAVSRTLGAAPIRRRSRASTFAVAAAAMIVGVVLGWTVASRSPKSPSDDLATSPRADTGIGTAPSTVPAAASAEPKVKGREPGATADTTARDAALEVPSVAKLALHIGLVELLSGALWAPLEPEEPIPAGTRIRTAPDALGEFVGEDGSVIRLDRSSEIEILSPRRYRLVAGRLSAGVARANEAFSVEAPNCRVVALGTRFDVAHSALTSMVLVHEGHTRLETADRVHVVRGGERAEIGANVEIRSLSRLELAETASWTNALLGMRGSNDAEFSTRLDDLLAGLGALKIDHFYAQELRALGPSCVIPLLRYVASPRSRDDASRRQRAASIAGELATELAITDLAGLLIDDDGEVREAAALALERITGLDQGVPSKSWRDKSREACEVTYLRWLDWIEKRRSLERDPAPAMK
jgi:ferric-dicitrate binding protein FerR (iron transport regulator)